MPSLFSSAPSLSPPTTPLLTLSAALNTQVTPVATASRAFSSPSLPPLSPLMPESPAPPLVCALNSNHLSTEATHESASGLVYGDPVRTKYRSMIVLNGFRYTKSATSSKKVTYRCSFYRRKEKCKGRVEFTVVDMAFTNFRSHICHKGNVVPSVRNVEKEMKNAVDDIVLQNLSMSAERVWERVRETFYSSKDEAVQGLSREQVRQRVYRTRREYFGGSMHGLVEVPPLSLVQGSTMSFFQFHRVYAHKGNKGPTTERHIGWGHPVIIDRT
ncbi:unnamed protein product [Phytophthora lilii]|uniref:Unnamed protein product n=1 Tax=Phytophthora lilii TaxID=2077276 RepID=A0A9W7CYZ1_9STRA|nr:unnamed protein product [Phytophthora lilii]